MSIQTKDLEFIEFNKRNSQNESIWTYFLREVKGQHAQCKFNDCKKILKSSGTTSTLHTHLKSIHSIVIERPKAKSNQQEQGNYRY